MALSELQKQERATGIGGSEMAAVLGLDPWRQPIDVFFEKRHDLAAEAGYIPNVVDENENEAVLWGNLLEASIADGYARKTDRKVQRANIPARHKEAHWLVANIDRRVVGERRGVEIKNVSGRMAYRWGPPGTDEVAEYYLPQVMAYMLVHDFPVWDVAALVGGSELRIYEIERDPEWDDIILDGSAEFWGRVQDGNPPPIDPDAGNALDVIRRVYPGTDGSIFTFDENLEAWAGVMQDAKEQIKNYQGVVDGAKAHLLAAMGNAAIGQMSDGTGFTRKVVKRKGYSVEPAEYVDFRFSKNPK